jgi:N-acetylated-alpha-linked acidic dipeptidase
LPFEFTNFADTVGVYVREVTTLTDTMREETKLMNQMISDGMLVAVQDPTEKLRRAETESERAFSEFRAAAKRACANCRKARGIIKRRRKTNNFPPSAQKSLDEIFLKTERALTNPNGLPRRDWFKHQIYAPGFYTGYGVKTLPSVREAIEQRDWREAQRWKPTGWKYSNC